MEHRRIAVVGDPHGSYDAIIRKIRNLRADTAIVLGDWLPDQGPFVPIAEAMRPLLEDGVDLRWILGNHDCDKPETTSAALDSLADRLIDHEVVELGDLRVGGLGGVFRGQVWYPDRPDAPVVHQSREAHVAALPKHQRFRGGVPLRHRGSIYPADMDRLRGQRADVLLSHEAGTSYSNPRKGVTGWPMLDQLAADMGVKVHIHGHHHHSYELRHPETGVWCVGFGMAEVILLDDILADAQR